MIAAILPPRVENLAKRKFHWLRVIRFAGMAPRRDGNGGAALWLCRCKCGVERPFRAWSLKCGDALSCGCWGRDNHGQWGFTGYKEITGQYWGQIQQNARKREIVFDLTLKYVWRLFLKQERRCALTGVELLHRGPRGRNTASLDRIDSSRGYVRGNVQWVHKDINIIKGTKSQDAFIQMCRRVVEYADRHVSIHS